MTVSTGRRLNRAMPLAQALAEAAGIIIASFLAFPIAGDWSISAHGVPAIVLAGVFIASAAVFGTFRDVSRALDASNMLQILYAAILGGAASFTAAALFPQFAAPAHVAAVAALLVLASLFGTRTISALLRRRQRAALPDAKRTVIVGTGNAAQSLIRIVDENLRLPFSILGCVDDSVVRRSPLGTRVLGRIKDLPSIVCRLDVDCVIIAIPGAPVSLVNSITAGCAKAVGPHGRAPTVKVLPGVSDLLTGGVSISRIRDVRLEDLLPREPVITDLSVVAPHLEHQIVLVTGAGGSIGSELCRQIIGFNPKTLLLLGHGENSLVAIDQELREKWGFSRTKIVLADVADVARVRAVFSRHQPDIVFHAAAHKHVPILEENVCEAVRNNIFGTHVVALAAAAAGVGKFVLLSTDKAVNPTSVMGATKRFAELISQSFAHRTATEFVSVRFGNVMGSRGSVLPIFKRQIEAGGPVTITHRDMERYFMTIPEAVSLVLQAMALGQDGQVFVLDMGKPVKILELAEAVIILAGLTPYRDIDIVETGIRPGEKLYEEIFTQSEGLTATSHRRLFVAQQERLEYDLLAKKIHQLEEAVRLGQHDRVLEDLRTLVPSYQPSSRTDDGADAELTATNGPAPAARGDGATTAERVAG